MLRLLMLTQFFDPEPTPRGLSFAQALVDQGFDVEVLTGVPNYPRGDVYPGYKLRAYQRERFGRVTVHRAWLYPDHSRSWTQRATNYLSFGASAAVVGLLKIAAADVVYAYHPPATVGI